MEDMRRQNKVDAAALGLMEADNPAKKSQTYEWDQIVEQWEKDESERHSKHR